MKPGDAFTADRGTDLEFDLFLPDGRRLVLGRPVLVMGVVNVTPDSFSDGGLAFPPLKAVERGRVLVEEGADLLDVGGESTRPGARPVSPAEEQERVLPVIEGLAGEFDVPISIDTRHGTTARAALEAGASIVNDVSALEDPLTAKVVARSGAPVVLMHMRGTSEDMYRHATYDDVLAEVATELRARIRRALDAGVKESQIILDPGIGFAKKAEQSAEVLRRLRELGSLGRPLLVGPSRKSFLSRFEDVPAKKRRFLTLGAVCAAVANGAHVVRVHDVRETVQAVRVFESLSQT